TTTVTFHTFQPEIGTIKLDASGASSLSEAMAQLLWQLQLSVTQVDATNLLTVIEQSTQNFRSLSTSAETFETVAQLLRQGARRSQPQVAVVSNNQTQPPTF